jgi:general stress protein YciG
MRTDGYENNYTFSRDDGTFSEGENVMDTQKRHGQGRGFASMSTEKKREIASKGGKAAHALGTAHKWTSEEAQAAGRKGGSISRRRSKAQA